MLELQNLTTEDLHRLRNKANEELDMCCQTLCNKACVKEYIKTLEQLLMNNKEKNNE